MKNTRSKREEIKSITRVSDGIEYHYTLFSSTSERVASFGIPLYSIEVMMIKDGEESKSSINDVFADIGKAIAFMTMLADGLATPIDLHYILEDMITVKEVKP